MDDTPRYTRAVWEEPNGEFEGIQDDCVCWPVDVDPSRAIVEDRDVDDKWKIFLWVKNKVQSSKCLHKLFHRNIVFFYYIKASCELIENINDLQIMLISVKKKAAKQHKHWGAFKIMISKLNCT